VKLEEFGIESQHAPTVSQNPNTAILLWGTDLPREPQKHSIPIEMSGTDISLEAVVRG